MLSRAAAPAARQIVARRGFQTTRAQLSSPYHYPEGPYSNLPFNPKTKYFALRFWGFMAVGFGAPFGIAGMWSLPWGSMVCRVDADWMSVIYSLADVSSSVVNWWCGGYKVNLWNGAGVPGRDGCVYDKGEEGNLRLGREVRFLYSTWYEPDTLTHRLRWLSFFEIQ